MTLASLAVWLILALALPLSALTLNIFHFGGFPLGFWIAAQGALIGLVVLVGAYAWRAGGTAEAEGLRPALVFAGEAIGAVTLLGFTGAIAALGYDGLALPLGLVAGVAPHRHSRRAAVRALPRAFDQRLFRGALRRQRDAPAGADHHVGGDALAACGRPQGRSACASGLTRLQLSEAVTALVLMVGLMWIAGVVLKTKHIAGFSYIAILGGLLVTLVAVAIFASGSIMPHLTLGAALQSHANLNQTLVISRTSNR